MNQQLKNTSASRVFDGQSKLLVLFGRDLDYSQSPMLHNTWLADSGLNAAYLPLSFDSAEHFVAAAEALSRSPNFLGANITQPFKSALLANPAFAPDERTLAIGAANTIFRSQDGGRIVWRLTNTDVEGVLATLALWPGFLAEAPLDTIVIGAGGAAASVAWAIRSTRPDASITVVCRDSKRAHSFLKTPLAKVNFLEASPDAFELGDSACLRILQNSQLYDERSQRLLVSCLPLGNRGEPNPTAENLITKLLAAAPDQSFFFDLAYGGSLAVRRAAELGVPHQDGKLMLRTQAERSFSIWRDSAAQAR